MTTDNISPEQLRFASWLHWTSWLGLTVLVAAFFVYATGLVAPAIPLDQLPRLWRLPARELMSLQGLKGGWSWALALDRSDMLNLLGIALLSGAAVPPLLAVTGLHLRHGGDRLFVALCLLQVAALVVAASGLIAAGG